MYTIKTLPWYFSVFDINFKRERETEGERRKKNEMKSSKINEKNCRKRESQSWFVFLSFIRSLYCQFSRSPAFLSRSSVWWYPYFQSFAISFLFSIFQLFLLLRFFLSYFSPFRLNNSGWAIVLVSIILQFSKVLWVLSVV